MGIFTNETKCAHCGKKAGRVLRQKLSDGSYICGDCWKGMPGSVMAGLKEVDYEGFVKVLDHIEYSKNELSKIFKENHSFYGIHIDTEHKLFFLQDDHPRIYYKFEEISEFDMQFVADEVKEGFLGTKVTGKIYYTLRLEFPAIFKEGVLARDVKAKAKVKDGFFKSKVVYDNPGGMDEFLVYFKKTWKAGLDDKVARLYSEAYSETYEETYHETYEEPAMVSEIQQAMALFMFDNLEDITLEKLDRQRKRLLKTFHPDEGSSDDTGFAQKINVAYDVLKQAVA